MDSLQTSAQTQLQTPAQAQTPCVDYKKWSRAAKEQMVETSRNNMLKRLEQIRQIIAFELKCKGIQTAFVLPESAVNEFFGGVQSSIMSWKGVDLSFCASTKTDFVEYSNTAMNWFNRNKAKVYGNHFFYPLLFVQVLNFCNGVCGPNIGNPQRIDVFVEILLNVLTAKIKFPRTKQQPLIPNQTLMQPNNFKRALENFLRYFDVELDPKEASPTRCNRVYKNDKQRSNKMAKRFLDALCQIQTNLRHRPQAMATPYGSTNTVQSPQLTSPFAQQLTPQIAPQMASSFGPQIVSQLSSPLTSPVTPQMMSLSNLSTVNTSPQTVKLQQNSAQNPVSPVTPMATIATSPMMMP